MTKLIRVYGWRNIHTDEWYIGQTSRTMKMRAGYEGYNYKMGCKKFGAAIKEYGWSAFEGNILRLCTTKEEADHWEKHYIQKYNSIENGYNMSTGGSGHHSGVKCSSETKRRMSESHMGKMNRPDISKRVFQYSKDGQFIAEYPSIKEASRHIGVDRAHISRCCSEKRKSGKNRIAGGCIWRYAE